MSQLNTQFRKSCGAENFSRLRRIVVKQLKNDLRRVNLKTQRYRRSIDRQHLLDILSRSRACGPPIGHER